MAMHALGIDIGGSGIKAAPVDMTTGKFLADRLKIETPHPALPDPVANVVRRLATYFNWSGPVGITFPGVVIDGVTRTAANMDPAWVGLDAASLFTQGILVPNTEFGHVELHGEDAEKRASERAKDLHDLSWGKWAGRVDEYLRHIEAVLWPNLFILGGGVSRQADKWVPRLTGISARIVPAALLNDAGIVGAAMASTS